MQALLSLPKESKGLSESRQLFEAYNKTVPKPSKATGACWIDHKYRVMERFENILVCI